MGSLRGTDEREAQANLGHSGGQVVRLPGCSLLGPREEEAHPPRKMVGYYDEEGGLIETGIEGDTHHRTRLKSEVYTRT